MAAVLERISIPSKDGRPNVVVFDIFETLVDDRRNAFAAMQRWARSEEGRRFPVARERILNLPDESAVRVGSPDEILTSVGLGGDDDAASSFGRFLSESVRSAEPGTAFAGAAQFLDAVESAGGCIVLVGTRGRTTAETDRELSAHGLRRESLRLLARPHNNESDVLYKRELLIRLSQVAHVIAVFDDDPRSLLAVELELPKAMLVDIDTQILRDRAVRSEFRQVRPAEDAAKELSTLVAQIRGDYEDDLPRAAMDMTEASTRRLIAHKGGLDAAIGLSPVAVSPVVDAGSAARDFLATGVPRFSRLNAFERLHETAFATEIETRAPELVAEMRAMAYDEKLDTLVFEVDAAKRLYSAYGKGKRPANEDEGKVRLLANHALHPGATAVTRLAFLSALDDLAKLPEDDPKRSVFVTCGGCAAGKGNLTDLVKSLRGSFTFGAVWDAAGENDAEENQWILEAAQQRGLKVVFGFVENDPMVQYNDVLGRAEFTGRIVDVVTFARSYVNGQRNFRKFLSSPQYALARKAGEAEAVGLFAGPFNRESLSDPSASPYPQARLLGNNGVIEAADIAVEALPSVPGVASRAVRLFETWSEQRTAQGKSNELFLVGALGNTLKFHAAEISGS